MKFLILPIIFVISVVQGAPFRTSDITGEIVSNTDGSVKLVVNVLGGTPAPDTFRWTLPDKAVVLPGRTHNSFAASTVKTASDGSLQFELILKDGYTTSAQDFIFRAESLNRWHTTFTFNLSARTTRATKPAKSDDVLPTLLGETDFNTDGSIRLRITVIGGNPKPTIFRWTLPGGSTLQPGRTSGSYQAALPRRNRDGTFTYILNLRDGQMTSAQSIKFKAEATNGSWRTWNFNIPAKNEAKAILQGRIKGSAMVSGPGDITIEAEVIEGTPMSSSYVWTVQKPDGTYVDIEPSHGQASAIVINSRGNPTSTLTITAPSSRTRRFKLYVTSETRGRLNWWASRSWTVGASA